MTWTVQAPTKPGWYWFRDVIRSQHGMALITEQDKFDGGKVLMCSYLDNECFSGSCKLDRIGDTEWFPISLPDEPEARS